MAKSKTNELRILLVSESLRPSGRTRFAMTLFRGLSEAGFQVFIVAPEQTGLDTLTVEELKRVETFSGMLGGWSMPFFNKRLVSWVQASGFALIHGLSAFTAPICHRLAQTVKRPYILGVNHYQERGGLQIGSSCRKILAGSEAIRENLVNTVGLSKDLIRLVPIGIRLPSLNKQVMGDERHPVVVTCSSLTPRADLATFLHAARRVLDVRCGACQFLIVGDGPEEPALRKKVRLLNLEKHVTFAHGNVPVDRIMNDADVYLKIPKQQGFCFSVLEAMSWALPVVASSVGGIIPLVRDGITGFLVPPGDDQATAGRILDILQDPNLQDRMGKAGRQTIIEKFSFQSMIQDTSAVYAEVLGAAKTAAESPLEGGISRSG